MTIRRWHAAACAAAWALVAAVLHLLGRDGALNPPSSWDGITSWYVTVGPTAAAMSLVRLSAIVGATWLAIATALQLAASVPAGRALRRAADAISPRWLTTLGRGMAGVSLSAGLALPAVAPALRGVVPVAPTFQLQQAADDEMPTSDEGAGVAVMRPLPGGDAAAVITTTSTTVTPSSNAPSPVEASPAELWRVEPGDSCWSIAEEVLRERSAEPSESEVRTYWLRLIEANRTRFVTGDPDLLFAGQELLLPELG